VSSQIEAKIGAHYEQEIACCALLVIAQFVEICADPLEKIFGQVNEKNEQVVGTAFDRMREYGL
jgi:hypothetical protein